jgi:hypothetical protein
MEIPNINLMEIRERRGQLERYLRDTAQLAGHYENNKNYLEKVAEQSHSYLVRHS